VHENQAMVTPFPIESSEVLKMKLRKAGKMNRKLRLISTATTILVTVLLFTSYLNAADYFVDISTGDNANSGLDWQNAFRDIVHSIEYCEEGDSIHVAQGVYIENVLLKDSTNVLGGYPTGGGNRDWSENLTVIDGNELGSCVVGADNALLDGFTLQNGKSESGGGIQHSYISMNVINCTIRSCTATGGNPFGGGGMHFINSGSYIENCIIIGNETNIDQDFVGTEVNGGGIHMWTSSPTFVGCSIIDNHVIDTEDRRGLYGGGAWAVSSHPTFRSCRFEGNSAMYGGGLGWWNLSIPVIEDCVFVNNSTTTGGAGICGLYNTVAYQPYHSKILDCIFDSNFSVAGSGALIVRRVKVIFENCLFIRNVATERGAGAMVMFQSDVSFENCTFAKNKVLEHEDPHGSGIYCGSDCNMVVRNSIVADNIGAEGIYAQGDDPMIVWVEHCDVYGHPEGNYSRNIIDRTGIANNFSEDPLFVSGPLGDYYLSEPETGNSGEIDLGKSPCINAGSKNTYGYDARERTCRTDLFPDYHNMDLGYHYFRPGPYTAAIQPLRNQADVPVDTEITIQVRDMFSEIDLETISVKLNGDPVDVEITPCYRGYQIRYSHPSDLESCKTYQVSISAQNKESPPVPLMDGIIPFKTRGCPSLPDNSPTPPPETGPPILEFICDETSFSGGDLLHILYDIYNPFFHERTVDLHIALEVYGVYYVYPVWDEFLHPVFTELSAGQATTDDVMNFELPLDLESTGPYNLLGVMTNPKTYDVVGDLAYFTFYFE